MSDAQKFENPIDMSGNGIENVADPTNEQDADTKHARDAAIETALTSYARKFEALIGDGTTTTIPVGHNLDTSGVTWSFVDTSTDEGVDGVVVKIVDSNNFTATFETAPGTNAVQVTVVG